MFRSVSATSRGILNSHTPFAIAAKAPSLSSSLNRISNRFFSDFNNIIVVGGYGAIGKALPGSLLNGNDKNRIFSICKPEQLPSLEKGISITKQGTKETIPPNERFVVSDSVHKVFEKYDISEKKCIAFAATKARNVVESLAPFNQLNRSIPIVLLQNGMGVKRMVKEAHPSLAAFKGHVLGAATHDKFGDLHVYPGGTIVVEKNVDPDFSEELKKIFGPNHDNNIFNLKMSTNILQDLYPKFAVNCACNPLTVILNLNLGAIRQQWEKLVRMICNEVQSVAMAQGIELPSNDSFSDFVLKMMSQYPEHYSSMYRDLQEGKPSEINYINAAVLKIADEKKVYTPLTQLLTDSIIDLEKKWIECKSASVFYAKNASFLEKVKDELMSIVHSRNTSFENSSNFFLSFA